MHNDLKGVFPALVTPLLEDETIDKKAVRRIVARIIDGGVNGVVVLGSSGEGVMLDDKERRRLVETTVDEVNGRVPVIVGAGDISVAKTKQNNRIFAGIGANYSLVFPPFYFRLRSCDIVKFYQDIAMNSAIPVILYNVPQNTKIHIDLKAVEKLKKTSNIVGIKDSSGNWDYLQELILAFQDEFFKVFVGNAKNLYAAYTAGAAGSITPVSNLDPKAETVMYDNIVNGDLIQALENQKRALKIASLFEYEGLPVCVKAKAAMALMGLCKNRNLKPLPQVASKDIEEVKNVLLELGLL